MKVLLSFLTLFIGVALFAQTSVTISITKDAQVISGALGNNNYGSSSNFYVYKDASYTRRTFLEFDCSNIPENAIILSADLKLRAYLVFNSQNHPFYIETVDASWTEGGITWNNQPSSTSSTRISIPHNETTTTSTYQEFDVTDHVQRMVNYPSLNHGLVIKLQNETLSGNYGVAYRSSEYSTQQNGIIPKIEVKYVLPIEITGDVFHATNGNTDGSIEIDVTEGSGTYSSYEWFELSNETLTSLESGTNIANADLDNIDDGLYLFTVEDDEGVEGYKYFLVGKEGETTDVEFFLSQDNFSKEYNEDANLFNYTSSGGGRNFGDYRYLYMADFSSVDLAALVKFKAEFDPILDFSSADYYLYGLSHLNYGTGGNSVDVSLVTEDWSESTVTWDSRPDTSYSILEIIAASPAGSSNRNDTVNLMPFVEYWQSNPENNFGIDLSLSNYPNNGNKRLLYRSSDETNNSYRPRFKLSYSVRPRLETTWDDSTYTADLTVNAPHGALPYSYRIANAPMPSLNSLWNSIKDSVAVDSVAFFEGTDSTRNYVFENLPPGEYYVSVFDDAGSEVFSNEMIYVHTDSMIYDSLMVGTLFDGKTLEVNPGQGNTSGHAFMKGILNHDDEGGFAVKIGGLDDVSLIGFNDEDDTLGYVATELEFGFKTSKISQIGSAEIIVNNAIVDTIAISVGDTLALMKKNNTIHFLKNGSSVKTSEISPVSKSNYKMEMHLNGLSTELNIIHLEMKFPAWANKIVTHATCGESDGGEVEIYPSSWFGYTLTSCTLTGASYSSTLTTFPGSFSGLSAGSYSLQTTWTNGSYSVTYTEPVSIGIGYELIWGVPDNMVVSLNDAIYPTPYTGWGEVTSFNETSAGALIENWMSYHHTTYEGGNSGMVSYVNSSDEELFSIQTFEFVHGLKLLWIMDDAGDVQDITAGGYSVYPVSGGGHVALIGYANPEIKVSQTDDDIDISFNGTVVSSFTTGVSDKVAKIKVEAYGGQIFSDVIASFCNFDLHKTYFELSEKVQPGFYEVPTDDILRVKYYEEYLDQDDNLSFQVINSSGQLEAMSTETVEFGDNRKDIDVSGLAAGYYTFVVTNEKEENWYLRFKVQ